MVNDAQDLAILARSAVFGAVSGSGLTIVLAIIGQSQSEASAVAFSLAALVFGFGLTVWASTLLLSESLRGMHAALDRDWNATNTRQAMAVLTVFGAAGMIGASVATTLLGG